MSRNDPRNFNTHSSGVAAQPTSAAQTYAPVSSYFEGLRRPAPETALPPFEPTAQPFSSSGYRARPAPPPPPPVTDEEAFWASVAAEFGFDVREVFEGFSTRRPPPKSEDTQEPPRGRRAPPRAAQGALSLVDASTILGVPAYAKREDVNRAWREKIRAVHPDHAVDDDDRARRLSEAKRVNAARDVMLGDGR